LVDPFHIKEEKSMASETLTEFLRESRIALKSEASGVNTFSTIVVEATRLRDKTKNKDEIRALQSLIDEANRRGRGEE
jgi:hypothetical protein